MGKARPQAEGSLWQADEGGVPSEREECGRLRY